MIRAAFIVALLPSLAAAQTLTARQRDAILQSAADVVCVGDQYVSLPASSTLTGAQAAAAASDVPASSTPAAVKPLLLYFTQPNCGPCRKVEQLQTDANVAKWLRNGFEFRKLDIRQAGGVYDVYRTPTHVVLAGGKEIMRFGYVVSAADYARKLDAAWRAAGGKR